MPGPAAATTRSLVQQLQLGTDCLLPQQAMRVVLEFSGGMELLFGGQKNVEADIPEPSGSGKASSAWPASPGSSAHHALVPRISGQHQRPVASVASISVHTHPFASQLTVGEALVWARDHLLTERPELFMLGVGVRPGILVLVNDVDWELWCAGRGSGLG